MRINQVHRGNETIFKESWLTDFIILTLFISFFYFFFLGSYPLFTPDEGRYSEVAREMVVTGDYITPRVNGVAFLDKPVLYYWFQAASIHLFGVNEWALRFFPALIGMIGCLVTYACGRRLFNRRAGLLSAVILATSPLYFIGGHYANLDLEVAVFVSMTLLLFITAMQCSGRARSFLLYGTYTCSAFAMLTKGLIGIVFPSMIIGVWILMLNRFALLKKIHLIAGVVIFLTIVLPWYILVQQANPEFLHFFFVTQQVSRFLSSGKFNNPSPLWFYLPVAVIGFFPWIFFFGKGVIQSIKNIWRDRQTHSIELFLLLWIIIVFGFFSFPKSKIVTYLLPIFPALALLTGKYLSDLWDNSQRIKIIFKSCAIFSMLLLLGLTLNASKFNAHTAKPLALSLRPVLNADDEIVNYFSFHQDIPIYLERRITLVADWNSPQIINNDNWIRELWFGMAFQKTDDWLISEKIFWQRWNSNKRVFTFVNDRNLKKFKSQAKSYFLVAQKNKISVFCNMRHPHPNPLPQ